MVAEARAMAVRSVQSQMAAATGGACGGDKNHDQGDRVGGHQRMHEYREQQVEDAGGYRTNPSRSFDKLRTSDGWATRDFVSHVEREGDGQQRERRGEAARGDVGVKEHEGGRGDGQCPPGSEQGDAAELGGVAGKAAAQQQASSEECEGDAEELDQQEYPWQRQMGDADDCRDEWGEE